MYKRVMIVEDESSTRQLLANIVKTVEYNAKIVEFPTIEGVYEAAMSNHFDLFLLDIIMDPKSQGDMSGLRFADKIRTVKEYEFTPIIFVTSLEDAELYAYSKLHSFGYIEKPFHAEDVQKVISDALRYLEANQRDNSLFLRKDGIVYSIKYSELVYVESVLHQLHFYKENGEVIKIRYKTLKDIMNELDDRKFIQCSRNVVINKDFVANVDGINKYIKLRGVKEPVCIGKVYVKKVIDEFQCD